MNAYLHLEGTYRALNPEETLARIRPLYEKIGITRVADISGLDLLNLPVVSAIRPNGKNLSTALGKGISAELAEISAVMESFEGYHAENLPPPELVGSYHNLKAQGYAVIDPTPFAKGVLVHPDIHCLELGWITAEILNPLRGSVAMHPSAFIYIPHTLVNLDLSTARPESYYFQVSSNGLASGNTLEEATCHALYELIERDAFYQFGQIPEAKRQLRMLQLESVDNPIFMGLTQKIHSKALSLKIWDITHHMNIPSFHCCLYDESRLSPIYFSSGSGSHLSRDIALLRAVTEAIQGRTALISGMRDDIYPNYYLYQQKLQQEQGGMAEVKGKKIWQDCLAPPFSHSFTENVIALLECIKSPIYRVNLTREDLQIPVVFCIAADLNFTGARM